MENIKAERNTASEAELELLLAQLYKAQLALDENATATSKLLQIVLGIVNGNLVSMKTQLEQIRDLSLEINRQTEAMQ